MGEEWLGSQNTFSSFDKMRIHYRHIKPRGPTCNSILLVHGLGEHAGRYNNFYHSLAPKGYEIYAPDLRGHGLSEGRRGHIDRFDDFLKDVDIVRQKMQAGKPKQCGTGGDILAGHSMGGLISLRYALDRQNDFKAVVVTGPALEIAVEVPAWKETLGKTMSGLFPKFTQPNGLDPNALSHNKAVVDAYLSDPLVHDKVTARWFTEFVATMNYVHENAPKLKIPILIMHGSDDSLAGVGGSKKFFEKCGSPDKELKIYDGAFHELYNETNYDEVLKYLLAWLKARNL